MYYKAFFLGLAATLTIICLSLAQQGPPGQGGGGGRGPSVEDRLERMTEELSLTDDQVVKIKPILEKVKKEMDALRDNRSGDREQQMEAMKKIMDSEEEQISALLTDEQKTKLAAIKKEREKNRPAPGQGGPPPR
jgi:Spy/CpxP family protein refolding chaperone